MKTPKEKLEFALNWYCNQSPYHNGDYQSWVLLNKLKAETALKFVEAYHAQYGQSLDSLIERVRNEMIDSEYSDIEPYNKGLSKAIEILRATPCIKAKALRKKGTNEYYRTFADYYGSMLTPDLWHKETTISDIEDVAGTPLPADAELIPIQILIP